MFRYRCPQCRQILQAPEMRAGKATVCPKCSKKITIPADSALWLNEAGEPIKTAAKASEPERARPAREKPTPADDVVAPIRISDEPAAAAVPRPEIEIPVSASASVSAPKVEPSVPEVEVPAASAERQEATSTATLTPPPVDRSGRPGRGSGSAGKPQPRQVVAVNGADETVSFNQPLHLRTEMDIAAALTDVLTTRMKPPPKPPRDLNPSTAFWLLLTGMAVILLGVALFSTGNTLRWVFYIGAAEIVIGYVWIVVLVMRRDPKGALICAVPPLTIWYLTRQRYRRYRPLRFVLTGAFLIALAGLTPFIQPKTQELANAFRPSREPVEPDIESKSDVAQLREYSDKRQFDRLMALLRKLDKTDPTFSASAGSRIEIAAELRKLCNKDLTPDTTIRAAALPAFVRWSSGDDARDVLLVAVQGHPDERREAIKLLPRWRDADVARVLASRLGNREESYDAKNALIDLGGPLAVQALIPLLRDKQKDKVLHLVALDLLAHPRIADEQALAFLREEKDKFADQSLTREAEIKIQVIQNILREKQKQ